MTEIERIVEFEPAYDKRDSDPKKNYGVHGVTLRMLVKGDKGATQFVLYTGWLLPETVGVTDDKFMFRYGEALKQSRVDYPMPIDLGYHSPKPMYEDQYRRDDCDVLDGVCYYDGSSLNAEHVFAIMLREGAEGTMENGKLVRVK